MADEARAAQAQWARQSGDAITLRELEAEAAHWKQLAGKRAKVYEALADAGTAGLTDAELQAVVPLAGMHLQSLIAEGHGITTAAGTGERWVLTKDAWA